MPDEDSKKTPRPRNWDMKYEKVDFFIGGVVFDEFSLSMMQMDYSAVYPGHNDRVSIATENTQVVSRVVMSREAFLRLAVLVDSARADMDLDPREIEAAREFYEENTRKAEEERAASQADRDSPTPSPEPLPEPPPE